MSILSSTCNELRSSERYGVDITSEGRYSDVSPEVRVQREHLQTRTMGKVFVLSISAARGATSFSANSCTAFLNCLRREHSESQSGGGKVQPELTARTDAEGRTSACSSVSPATSVL